ncbi:MAG: sigma-54 dependent transcriptional regulator [Thermoanaerobaculia bacterium]
MRRSAPPPTNLARTDERVASAAVEAFREADLAVSEELIRLLTSTLDVREVFPQVSEIAQRALPHDRMTMTFNDAAGGSYVLHAASNDDGPTAVRASGFAPAELAAGAFKIVDDLGNLRHDIIHDPPDYRARVVAAGYRSLLAVALAAREQQFGVQFWAKRHAAFDRAQLPIARRIAEHLALAVSHQQLAEAVRRAAEAQAKAARLETRVRQLSEELESRVGYGRMVGRSQAWQDVIRAATQVAATDTTVLLTGESGTGKEVIARYLHRASPRSSGPFVAVNSAALPEHLLESELFGHERGAFTGAQQAKPGQIERAAGGVLFLDEIAEMIPSAQAKLLRVLQEREFQRLGGSRTLRANVRVVAATNRDLRRAVERGDFREDLFYRLNVFEIHLPLLAERPEDILPLAEAFLDELARSFGRPPAGMTREAKEAMLAHSWPGNVRELRNVLERAAILCEGSLIAPEHLVLQGHRGERTATLDVPTLERRAIEQALRETQGNKARAARRLGISRKQLYVRLKRYSALS